MLNPEQLEEKTLRENAVKMLRENIEECKLIENELNSSPSTMTRKKRALSAIGQSQVSKAELVRQLKKELENLVSASENIEKPLSGEVLSQKMYESLDRFLKLEKSRVETQPRDHSLFKAFCRKTEPLVICHHAHNSLRTYANDRYGNAQKHFFDIILRLSKTAKHKDKPSRALDLRTKTGDFLVFFYPTPTLPRDQLIIDTFSEFSRDENSANRKSEIYAIGAIMADLSSFKVTLQKMADAKAEYKGDDLKMVLDTFLEDFQRRYDAFFDPKEGLLKQIADPKMRKQLEESLRQVKTMVDAEFKESKKKKPAPKLKSG